MCSISIKKKHYYYYYFEKEKENGKKKTLLLRITEIQFNQKEIYIIYDLSHHIVFIYIYIYIYIYILSSVLIISMLS